MALLCTPTPVVGICKGMQQMCVHHGGGIDQQADPIHVGGHTIMMPRVGSFHTNGNHHQSCLLPDDAKSIAQSADHTPEIVRFSDKHLGFQYHPEWMESDTQGRKVFVDLVSDLMNTHSL